ncbi:MAG: CehA/McbA family metallohydrolase [Myxococcales bacterium]|nr:CehA/McbA family metallohydrolase [Myxococcales bacterium]
MYQSFRRSTVSPSRRYMALLGPLLAGLVLTFGAIGCGAKDDPTPAQTVADVAADTPSNADTGPDKSDWKINYLAEKSGPINEAVAQNGWYRGDLHFHTDYSEDAKKQGGDDVKTCLAIADAWRHPTWVKRFPQHAGNGLDFIAITDHRDVKAKDDPNFKHDHLIVLLGAEYGGNGHAGIWGVKSYPKVDHIKDETERHQKAIAAVHAEGGLFSPNHPTQSNMWHWDVKDYDAVELWNAPWSAFWPEETPAVLDEEIKETKRENPWIRQALTHQGGGTNHQALWFWYGHLASGAHPAAVGGSDRHMAVPAGLPTTYVHKPAGDKWAGKVGQKLGSDGIAAGIGQGGTFVSRSPIGPQIVLTAEAEPIGQTPGKTYPMGADLPKGKRYRIHITVTRANGGLLRLVGGRRVQPDKDGLVTAKADVLFEAPIVGARAEGRFTWEVPTDGGWIHALVLEQRIQGTLPPEMKVIDELTSKLPAAKAVGAIVKIMMALVSDTAVLFDGKACDTAKWQDNKALCMPMDKMSWGTFYLPEQAVRLMNTWFEDGKPTKWSMGAISSAFLAPAP